MTSRQTIRNVLLTIALLALVVGVSVGVCKMLDPWLDRLDQWGTPTPPISPMPAPEAVKTLVIHKFFMGQAITICTLDAWGVQALGERRAEVQGEWTAQSGIAFIPLPFGWQGTIVGVGADWLEVTGQLSPGDGGAKVDVRVLVEQAKVCW